MRTRLALALALSPTVASAAPPVRHASAHADGVMITVSSAVGSAKLTYTVHSRRRAAPVRVHAAGAVYEGDGLIEECPIEIVVPARGQASGEVACASGWDQLGVEVAAVTAGGT